jgi:hypothetical protein
VNHENSNDGASQGNRESIGWQEEITNDSRRDELGYFAQSHRIASRKEYSAVRYEVAQTEALAYNALSSYDLVA